MESIDGGRNVSSIGHMIRVPIHLGGTTDTELSRDAAKAVACHIKDFQ